MSDTEDGRMDIFAISSVQSLAIDRLLTGGSTEDAAEAAGVTRQTVSGWKNQLCILRLT